MDFRIMADIDREVLPEEEALQSGRAGNTAAEVAQFTLESAAFARIAGPVSRKRFNDKGGFLITWGAHANEGTAVDSRMGVEDSFNAISVERALRRQDAFNFAATKPETALLVAVAEVAHTVPAGTAFGMVHLGQACCIRAVMVCLRHDWPADCNLAHFPRRHLQIAVEQRDGIISDMDDA